MFVIVGGDPPRGPKRMLRLRPAGWVPKHMPARQTFTLAPKACQTLQAQIFGRDEAWYFFKLTTFCRMVINKYGAFGSC